MRTLSLENHKKKRKLSATTFQYDGAPAHFSVQARETLSKQFGDRLIGRGFDVMWPPRSPDLSPLDYWLWPLLKDRVYHQGQSINDLKKKITQEVQKITLGEMAAAVNNLKRRCELVIEQNGGNFKAFL